MLKTNQQLSTNDHRRDLAGMTYIYPVVSRRAGGLSIGINLNPNNACNWRCVYCQVENLSRGGAPELDLEQLRAELHSMLDAVVHGSFMQEHVPAGLQRLNDIALSGNGEPTTSLQFLEVIEIIEAALNQFGLLNQIKVVLITNGSQAHKPLVKQALQKMAAVNGEVWFKLDRGDSDDIFAVNQIKLSPERTLQQLKNACNACSTWIQSCFFAWDGKPPTERSVERYLQLLKQAKDSCTGLQGVLLYGVERPSMQAEAPRISKLPTEWLMALANQIESLGITVKVSA